MIINNVDIVLPNKVISLGSIVIKNNRIDEISESPVNLDNVFDASGLTAISGLIDIHIHGAMGYSVADRNPESLYKVSHELLKFGVTGFLWTTLASPIDELDNIMRQVGNFNNPNGAKCFGVYIEGSFISEKQIGSQAKEFIFEPSEEIIENWIKLSNNKLKVITISVDKARKDFIQYLKSKNIVASIGHTQGTYEEALQVLEYGASNFTHLGNAMGSFHQREPNIIGAGLNDKNSTVEIICDGKHLHPATVDIFTKAKGFDKTILISDACHVMGMPKGFYKWYDKDVYYNGETLTFNDGGLVAGTLALNKAVKNLMAFTNCDLPTAIRTVTLNPAKLLKIDKDYGSLEKGKIADIVLLDKNMNVVYTFLNGICINNNKI